MSQQGPRSTDSQTAPGSRLFHYTTGGRIESIVAEETLWVGTDYVLPGERPAVCFTTSEEWEETCNEWVQNETTGENSLLDRNQMESERGGLFRVEVHPAQIQLHAWNDYKRLAGLSEKTLQLLESKAKESGSDLAKWRVSFEPIPSSEWIRIERWSDDSWEFFWGDPTEAE